MNAYDTANTLLDMGQSKEVPVSNCPRNASWVWGAEVLLFCHPIPWSLKPQESQQTVPASALWKSLHNNTPIYLWKAREEMNGNRVEKWSSPGSGEWAWSLLGTNGVISNISQWKDGAVVGILLFCIFAFVLNQISSFKVGGKYYQLLLFLNFRS